MHDGEQVHFEEPPQNCKMIWLHIIIMSIISTLIHLKVQCNLCIYDTNINNFPNFGYKSCDPDTVADNTTTVDDGLQWA